ncbi:MAG TPA: BCCT family transporter [Beutenbergiaceae bacterium]|nr:BCCT family transporter [Beutenbergiaceae bacterium]
MTVTPETTDDDGSEFTAGTDDDVVEAPVYDPSKPWYSSIQPRVFYPAMGVILLFVSATMIAPVTMEEAIGSIQDSIVSGFSWYYAVLVFAFVVFALWVGLSHHGDVKLSTDDEKPEFRLLTWLAMLFAAGMGIGLVFWGAAEPLHHLAGIPNRSSGVADVSGQGLQDSLVWTFLHWGLHPWAIYVVVGLAIAYAVHVKNKPISIRWTLQPLLGNRVKGWIGDVIDVIAIVGTVFGVATSLGLGVIQIAGGLSFLDIVSEPSDMLMVILIGAITGLAIFSVVTGVKKGMKWLSNINMVMAVALMLFVFILGPTLFLLREYIQGIGAYFQSFLQVSFNTSALSGTEGLEWQGWWTAFYWGWWISWAPFVGIFIARISRGRTVREFVMGVLLVPSMFSFLWFTVLGGGAMYKEVYGDGGIIDFDAEIPVSEDLSLFQFLADFPGGAVVSAIAVLLIVMFFVTSSDSGSLVVDMLGSGGMTEPPTWSRVLWAVLEGAVAIALLLAGGLMALRGVAISIALPFSVVMILMAVATLKQLKAERTKTLRIQRRMVREQLARHVSQTLIEDGLIDPPDGEPTATSSRSGRGRRRRRT